MGELDGRVAIVTGGASGIGEASARALAAAGAKVVVTALHEDRAKAVADSISATGAEALGLGFDTSEEDQVATAIEAAVKAFGGVDILHNNAAITSVPFLMRDGMIHELDADLWRQTMAVNLGGYMLCTKHVLPHMLERGRGVIVNTASGEGLTGGVSRAAYGTSKAAIIGFTRNVATQYGKLGIRCVTIVPGLTMTDTVAANMPPPVLEMMKRHTLTPELARPEDIANAILFLASDRAAFVTGIALQVDGGISIHTPTFSDEMAMYAAASGAEATAAAERFRGALEARGHATLAAEDVAVLDEVLATHVVHHGAGRAGTNGVSLKDDLVAAWNEPAQGPGGARIDVLDVYADATHVVALLELAANGSDRAVRQANVFHLGADGKATELWRLPADTAVLDALATGEPPAEHPNLTVFSAAEEARARNLFEGDDLAAIERFLREDVHWNSPWGGGPTNRDEVLAQFRAFDDSTGGTMRLDLNEVFADDAHAVSLVRLQAGRPDRPGAHMDVKEANVFHLDGEGRTYEFWGVAEDQAAINSFWAD